MRRFHHAAPAIALSVAWVGVVNAQPVSEKDATTEALAHFRKGNELFKQEAWAAALAELLESRRLKPTKNATANAAFCLQKLGRYDEALDLYQSLLTDFSDVASDLKEEVQRAMIELRGLVGTVEIDESEPGALVSIDGRARGEYPTAATLRVSAGSHAVRFTKEGFEPFETLVEVAGRKTVHLSAKLRPVAASGRLKVIEQRGLSVGVWVDGIFVGKAPWEGRVAAGDHVVFLRGEGQVGTQPVSIAVAANAIAPVTLAAEELAATLTVVPTPANANVAIDSVAVGRGIWEGRLRLGKHTVEVAERGFVTAQREVVLERGAADRLVVGLDRDRNSPFFQEPPRTARFMLEVVASVPVVPFGGAINANCIEPCSLSIGVGTHGLLRLGYELGGGFGAGGVAGWLTAKQSIRNRETGLKVEGLPDLPTVASDTLSLQTLLFGGWFGFRLATPRPIFFRFTAAAVLGNLSDARFASVNDGSRVFQVGTFVENFDARFVYLAPELRIGLPVAPKVELTAGLEVPVLIALDRAVWRQDRDVLFGSNQKGHFAAESLTGAVLVAVAPGIGARYDF